MNYIDIAITLIIAISLVISIKRGIVKEMVSLTTWIISIFAVLNYTEDLAKALSGFVSNPSLRTLISFFIIIISIFILGKIVNKILGAIIADSWFSSFDRIIGVAFGAARGVVLVSIIIVAADMLNVNYSSYARGSKLLGHFAGIAKTLNELVDDNYGGLKKKYLKISTNHNPDVSNIKS